MRPASLCPDPSLWRVTWVAVETERIVLHLRPVCGEVPCPLCRVKSSRIHSRYQRKVWDLPWFNWPVQLLIEARKFFCDVPGCLRRIFAEPFPNALGRYARQTRRTLDLPLELANCSSAEMASRVAKLLGFVTSGDTLIRLQRQEAFPHISSRILGIDEFALRKGRTYGTLLVDLELRRPIELLEGTNSGALVGWLQSQTQLVALARDQSGAYAVAGQTRAPQAFHVADRFHMVHNVTEALRELFRSRQWPA